MKTLQFSKSNVWIVIVSAFMTGFIFSCEDHLSPTTPALTVEEYFTKVNTLDIYILPQGTNDSIPLSPSSTLYDYIKYNLADVYRTQYNELAKLNPRKSHRQVPS